MRAGIAALPWTLPDPERGSPRGAWNCEVCLPSTAPAVRAGMHCGFMPEQEWRPGRAGLPKSIGPDPYTADLCPGGLVRDPAVIDAANAYAALEAGVLDRYDPLGLHVVTQAALLCKRAFNLYADERAKRAAARARQG